MKFSKVFLSMCVIAILVSISVTTAFAANITDVDYYVTGTTAGTWVSSNTYRYKEDNSKVYVFPSATPGTATKVRTQVYVGGIAANKTANPNGYVVLQNAKYAITNYCYEDGDYTTGYGVRIWLNLTPNSGSGTISGVWSA
ncbi:MAG: hypothetical protein LBJ84_07480, partial [Oscillospiraceae bacterium]|nr:hypothetical protein [Oscillospiraceae bacterium]